MYVLTPIYFSVGGQFYEQTGVAMGSTHSPVITTFFMEDFEKRALAHATHILLWSATLMTHLSSGRTEKEAGEVT
jgi:hypothetical protein